MSSGFHDKALIKPFGAAAPWLTVMEQNQTLSLQSIIKLGQVAITCWHVIRTSVRHDMTTFKRHSYVHVSQFWSKKIIPKDSDWLCFVSLALFLLFYLQQRLSCEVPTEKANSGVGRMFFHSLIKCNLFVQLNWELTLSALFVYYIRWIIEFYFILFSKYQQIIPQNKFLKKLLILLHIIVSFLQRHLSPKLSLQCCLMIIDMLNFSWKSSVLIFYFFFYYSLDFFSFFLKMLY